MSRVDERPIEGQDRGSIGQLALNVNGRGRRRQVDPRRPGREAGGGGGIPLHGGAAVIARDGREPRGHALTGMRAQVVEGLDVAEVARAGEVPAEHADLLALVDEGRSALEEVSGGQCRGRLVPGAVRVAEARHRARLIVVFQVEGIPAPHAQGLLPGRQDVRQLAVGQWARRELAVFLAEVDVLELDEHVEFASVWVAEQEGRLGGGVRGFPDGERAGMVGECALVHLLEELVQARAVGEALVADAEGSACGTPVGQPRALRDDVDRVDPETVHPSIEPPVHHVVDGVANLGILPVQVRLLAREQVQVVLARGRVVLPGRPPEEGFPVRGLRAGCAGHRSRARIAPVVPVATRGVGARSGFDEPRVLDGGVVHHQVHDDAHPEVVGASDERVEGLEVAKERVDVAVAGDVVSVVGLRRTVDG